MSQINASPLARPRLPLIGPMLDRGNSLLAHAAKWADSLSDLITFGPVIQDTHANRLNTAQQFPYWPPGRFLNYLFFETDRKTLYISQLASGTVNTNGTTVTFQTGAFFGSGWVNSAIYINGIPYQITAVASPTLLSIATSAGVQTGVVYSRETPDWRYVAGEAPVSQATLPADLDGLDAGFLANVTDYAHRLRWDGDAWNWAPGDPGSGFMQLFEVDPIGVGWHLYDGSTINYLKIDGTLGSVTLPDLISVAGNAAYPKAGSPNSGPNAAVAPVLSGNTGVDSASINVQQGTGGVVTVSAHTHTHPFGTLLVSATGEPRNVVRRPFFRQ